MNYDVMTSFCNVVCTDTSDLWLPVYVFCDVHFRHHDLWQQRKLSNKGFQNEVCHRCNMGMEEDWLLGGGVVHKFFHTLTYKCLHTHTHTHRPHTSTNRSQNNLSSNHHSCATLPLKKPLQMRIRSVYQ